MADYTNYRGDVRVVENISNATNYIGDIVLYDTIPEAVDFFGELGSCDSPSESNNYIGDVRIVNSKADATNYIGGVVSALLNPLPEWTLTPYFALPARGIDLIVGIEQTIYGDILIALPTPIPEDFAVTYTCNIGSASGNNYIINPITGNIGAHSLTAVFKLGSRTITTKTFNLNVIAAQSGMVSVLMVGDSLVYLGHADIATGMDAALTGAITFIGAQGTAIKHEGKSGFSYETFANQPTSPFRKDGALNIPAYFTDNSLATPEYIHMRLMVNSMWGNSDVTRSDSIRQVILNNEITYAKQLIAAFFAFDASIKIIISIPTISENTGAGWNANYDEAAYSIDKYNEWIHRSWVRAISEFDNDTYDERVIISNEAIFLDRNDGYPKVSGIHTNALHPAVAGYQQLGKGIANTINRELSLIPSGLTLSLISGGVKIDWTDNSVGTFETEIYGKSDSAEYALLYTIAAGTVTKSETIDAVDLRYYKIRGKNGAYFTKFSPEQSIAMLGPELVINGDFSAWTDDNPNGWTIAEGANGYFTEVAGSCRMVVTGSGIAINQNILTNGSKYRFKVNVIAVVSGQLSVVYSTLKYSNFNTTGQKTFYDTTDGTGLTIRRWSGDTDVTFDDISAQRVLMP